MYSEVLPQSLWELIEKPVNMIWDSDWDEIKRVLTEEVKQIAKKI